MPEQQQTGQSTGENKKKISSKMVRDVVNKVYALWLRDLAIEKERKR